MSTELTLTLSSVPVAKSLTKKGKVKKVQGRSWQLIIPSEWESLEAIKEVGKRISRNYYYIEHSHDVNELNEPVKSHWHILLTMSSSRDLGTVQNYFKDFPELLENSFEKIGSIHWAKRYLIHADDPNKYQYSAGDVETNDKLYMDLFIDNESKIEETNHINELYDQMDETSTFREFYSFFEPYVHKLSVHNKLTFRPYLHRYYNEFHKDKKDDGYTPVENSNDEVLPF